MFLLPDDVMSKQILPFLRFREVVRLDSALVNYNLRAYLHASLNGTSLWGMVDFRHIEWSVERKCSAKTLKVTSDLACDNTSFDALHFEDLRICTTAHVSEHALHRLLTSCKDLRHLNIRTFPTIRLHHFLPLATDLPLLEINTSGNRYLREDALVALVKFCPHLQVINASDCYRCTEQVPLALSEHCPQLREVFLTINAHLDEPHNEGRTGYCELFQRCRHLQVVDCSGDFTITNLQTLAYCCNGLTSVTVEGAYTMFWWEETHTARVDAALATLARNNTSIHTLKLKSFQRLSDDSLLAVAQCLPDLHTFQLLHCQGSLSGLAAIRSNCTKLRSFEVFRYHLFVTFADDLALRYLQLSILRTLSIFATALSDAQLVAIAQANPTIQTLRISSIMVAEGAVLSPNALCAALSYLPSLETVDVRVTSPLAYISPYALRLEDAVLDALVQYCPKVSAIDISGHVNLSNRAVSGLSSLPLLRSFIADKCVNLLDTGFCVIVQQCRHLEVVSLAHCPHISNVAVYALAQYCRHLTCVYLQECGGLQNSSFSA